MGEGYIPIEEIVKQTDGIFLVDNCILTASFTNDLRRMDDYDEISDGDALCGEMKRMTALLNHENTYVIEEVCIEFTDFIGVIQRKNSYLSRKLESELLADSRRQIKSGEKERTAIWQQKLVKQECFKRYIKMSEENLQLLYEKIVYSGDIIEELTEGICLFQAEKNIPTSSSDLLTDEKLIAAGLVLSREVPVHILTKDDNIFNTVKKMSCDDDISSYFGDEHKEMAKIAGVGVIYFNPFLEYIRKAAFPKSTAKK